MEETQTETIEELRLERLTRIRVGATGLAVIVIVVLLAASLSGTASDEPELTPEAIAEGSADGSGGEPAVEEQPQEPLAEMGVAPATAPVEEGAAPATEDGAAAE